MASRLARMADDDRCVVAAKTEAVTHGDANRSFLGLQRRVVQVAFGIGVFEVNRRRDNVRSQGVDGQHQLNATASAEGMPQLTFRTGQA